MTNTKNILISVLLATVVAAATATEAYAGQYGGTEIINKRFKIEKQVRIEGDDEWEDKITDVEPEDTVEFKIKIKNLTDDDADIDFDNMKMHDFLPDEMERTGGSGLTEYWDDFEPDESKSFIIEAEIYEDEFDRDVEFEKCVVNKASVYWDGEFEGSDTATVCYGDVEVKELPETGATSALVILGSVFVLSAFVIRKTGKKFAK